MPASTTRKTPTDRLPKNGKRHKSFDVDNIDDLEPITFDLGDEMFHCHAAVQGKVILDIMKAASEGDEETRGMMMAISLLDFFEKVMPEEEYQRLGTLMEDPKRIVKLEVLSEIMAWLMEEYSGRPTEPSSDF